MLILKKVAITGGLASGKSSVCKMFESLGAYTVSADAIVHQLLSPSTPIGKQIIQLLGQEIVQNGEFDRQKIASKVFNNKKILKSLEGLLHPATFKEIENQYNKIKNQNTHALFVAEIPLLYESESAHLFDHVIAVRSDEPIAKKRTKESNEEFEQRMTHQLPIAEKCAKADYIIENNGTLEQLETQVKTLYKQLTT